MGTNGESKSKKIAWIARLLAVFLFAVLSLGVATYAWYSTRAGIAVYAPVTSPEALYIGAGHRDMTEDTFEDIRYLYFGGLDAEGADYVDKVFCVYGSGIGAYKIQLAYTTNNPFTYQLYHATESEVSGSVAYVVHQGEAKTYYYSANGEAVSGNYLNRTTENGVSVATSANHADTYGEYNAVQKHAEPIYWQTAAAETGNLRGDFVNYYLLRINKNGKATNDRETDVICIAARAITVNE